MTKVPEAAHESVDGFEQTLTRVATTGGGVWPYAIGMIDSIVSDLHSSDEYKVRVVRNALVALGRVMNAPVDPTGLGYSRETDADDPTPVSPARVPLHTGAMTERGLVDETPASNPVKPIINGLAEDGHPCVASLHIPTPGETCGVCGAEGMRSGQHFEVLAASEGDTYKAECSCGTEVDGFDSFAEAHAELAAHIESVTGGQ